MTQRCSVAAASGRKPRTSKGLARTRRTRCSSTLARRSACSGCEWSFTQRRSGSSRAGKHMSAEAQTVRLCAGDASNAASSSRGGCDSANDDLIRAALAPAANFGTECPAFPVESPRGPAPSTDQDAEWRRSEALEVAWKRDRRVDIWQRFASPGSSLCKKPRLLGLPRVVHPISVIRTMQSFQCGTLMRDRGCAPGERRAGNRMRAENESRPGCKH
jgi:hypothetical protein